MRTGVTLFSIILTYHR